MKSRTVGIIEALEYSKARTISHEFSLEGSLSVAFTDGTKMKIESQCEMSYGDHPCPSCEAPEITIWEES